MVEAAALDSALAIAARLGAIFYFIVLPMRLMMGLGYVLQRWLGLEVLAHVGKFPPLYALAAALATTGARSLLGDSATEFGAALDPFWQALTRVRDAFVTVALATLGAQLAVVRREHVAAGRWRRLCCCGF